MQGFYMPKKAIFNKVTILLAALIIMLIADILLLGQKHKPDNNQHLDATTPPFATTEQMLAKTTELNNSEIKDKTLYFDKQNNLAANSSINIWIYSKPIFLGTFSIEEQNGRLAIKGIEEALIKLKSIKGDHDLVIISNNQSIARLSISFNEHLELRPSSRNEPSQAVNQSSSEPNQPSQNSQTKQQAIAPASPLQNKTRKPAQSAQNNQTTPKQTPPKSKPHADYNLNDNIMVEYRALVCVAYNTKKDLNETPNDLTRTWLTIKSSGKYFENMTELQFKTKCDAWKATLGPEYIDNTQGGGYDKPLEQYMCDAVNIKCDRW